MKETEAMKPSVEQNSATHAVDTVLPQAQVARVFSIPQCLASYLKAYVCCTLLFSMLLVAVYGIPKSLLRQQINESVEVLAQEGDYPRTLVAFSHEDAVDTFSTAISLNIAGHGTGNPLKDAVSCPLYTSQTTEIRVAELVEGLEEPPNDVYTRYWHGYLAILIPLLTLFNIAQIRTFFITAMALLSCAACVSIGRKAPMPYALALAFSLVSVNAWTVAYSTTLTPCFFVALIALLITVSHVDDDAALGAEMNWALFYFVVGAVTVYVDFLNTPIVSLGLPLATYLALRHRSVCQSPLSHVAGFVALCAVSWGLGYVVLWATKWLICFVVLGPDSLSVIFSKLATRAGTDETAGRLAAIQKNIGLLTERWQCYLALGLALLWSIVWLLRRQKNTGKLALALAAVAAMPLAWYLAIANHSTVHAFFTYRALCVSIYALSLMAYLLVDWSFLRRRAGND